MLYFYIPLIATQINMKELNIASNVDFFFLLYNYINGESQNKINAK